MTQKNKSLIYSELGRTLQEPIITGLMSRALTDPDMLSLAAGFTDNKKLPEAWIKKAFATIQEKGDAEYLQYGTNQGRPGLRAATANFLARYPGESSENFKAENLIISNGSQQTLYLAMQVLCDPGDLVLVEGPSYFVFLELLKGLGINAVTLPTLPNGRIDFPELEAWLKDMEAKGQKEKIKAIYTMGYYGNPSARCVPVEDKKSIASLVKAFDLKTAVIEDAAYREIYYKEPYLAPTIMSLPEMHGIPCLYLGTYTKPFASGLRIGYGCCSDSDWLQKMLYVKGHQDFGSSNFSQAIIETVLNEGWYDSWLDEVHKHYSVKAKVVEEALAEEGLAELGWSWDLPQGGLMIWLKGPEGLDTSMNSDFCETCLKNKVMYVPGDLCFAEGEPRNFVRLSYGTLNPEQLREGLRRFAKAARMMTSSKSL